MDSLLRNYIGKQFSMHFCDWTILITVLIFPISMLGKKRAVDFQNELATAKIYFSKAEKVFLSHRKAEN